MRKYTLAVLAVTVAVILVAMGVIQYVEVSYSREDAIAMSWLVGPVALVILGLIVAMLDSWRCRLVTDEIIAQQRG